jgi:hypothetical protein
VTGVCVLRARLGGAAQADIAQTKHQMSNKREREVEVVDLTGDSDDEDLKGAAQVDMGECAICMDKLSNGKATLLECCHAFHLECVVRWIQEPEKQKCPMCRSPVSIYLCVLFDMQYELLCK